MDFAGKYVFAVLLLVLGALILAPGLSSSLTYKPLDVSKFSSYIPVRVQGEGTYRLLLPSSDFTINDVNYLHVGAVYQGRMVELPSAFRTVSGGYELWFYVPDDNISQVFLFLGPEDNEPNPQDFRDVFQPYVVAEENIPICHSSDPKYTPFWFAARYDPRIGKIALALSEEIDPINDGSCDAQVKVAMVDPANLSILNSVCMKPPSVHVYRYLIRLRDIDFAGSQSVYLGSRYDFVYYSSYWRISTRDDFDRRVDFYSNGSYTYYNFRYPSGKYMSYVHVRGGNAHFLLAGYGSGYAQLIYYPDSDVSSTSRWLINFSTNCSSEMRENNPYDVWCSGQYCWMTIGSLYCITPDSGYYKFYLSRFSSSGSAPQKVFEIHPRAGIGLYGQLYSDGTIYYDGIKIVGSTYYTDQRVFGFHVHEPWIGPGKVWLSDGIKFVRGVQGVFASDGNYFYSIVADKAHRQFRLIKWTYNVRTISLSSFERHPVTTVPFTVEETNQLYSHIFLSGYIGSGGDYNLSVYVDDRSVFISPVSGSFDVNFDVNGIEYNTYHSISLYLLQNGMQVASYEYNAYFGLLIPSGVPSSVSGIAGKPVKVTVSVYVNPEDNVSLLFEENGQNIIVSPRCVRLSYGLSECTGSSVLVYPDPGVYDVNIYATVEHNNSEYTYYLGTTEVKVSNERVSFSGGGAPVTTGPSEVQEENISQVQPAAPTSVGLPSGYVVAAVLVFLVVIYLLGRRS